MTDDELIARAEAIRARAYAPYSGYPVGAAIRAGDEVYVGVNLENVAFPAGLCAERAALATAVTAGVRAIDAVAVVTKSSPPAAPCGVCLQTLLEFADDPAAVQVLLANPAGERERTTLAALLPRGFRRGSLAP